MRLSCSSTSQRAALRRASLGACLERASLCPRRVLVPRQPLAPAMHLAPHHPRAASSSRRATRSRRASPRAAPASRRASPPAAPASCASLVASLAAHQPRRAAPASRRASLVALTGNARQPHRLGFPFTSTGHSKHPSCHFWFAKILLIEHFLHLHLFVYCFNFFRATLRVSSRRVFILQTPSGRDKRSNSKAKLRHSRA